MKRTFNLGTTAWPGAAGPTPVNLAPIPDQYMSDSYRVARLILAVAVNFDVADQESWDGVDIMNWLTNIYVRCAEETVCNIGGLELALLLAYAHIFGLAGGMFPPDQAGILDDQIASFTLEVPFENLEAYMPQDYVVPAALFNDAEMIVTWGAAAPATGVTVNSATMVVWSQVERKNEVQIPALPFILSLTTTQFAQLQPGVYTELFAMMEDKDAFTAAAVTTVLMLANGETIHGAVNQDGLRTAYCWDHGMPGGGFYGVGDTDFADSPHVLMLPLIWPAHNPASNRVSQYIDTGGTPLHIEAQGSEANLRFVMRGYRPITAEGSGIKLGKMGAATPELVIGKRKTVSKVEISPEAVRVRNGLRILPVKVQGAQTQEALGRLASRFQPPQPGTTYVLRPR